MCKKACNSWGWVKLTILENTLKCQPLMSFLCLDDYYDCKSKGFFKTTKYFFKNAKSKHRFQHNNG